MNSLFKAAFFDLDGTLLNSNNEVLESSKRALLHLEENGIKTVLISARPPQSVEQFHAHIGLKSPFCSLNGAFLVEKSESISFELTYFNPLTIATFLQIADKFQTNISFYGPNFWQVNQVDKWVLEEAFYTWPHYELLSEGYQNALKILFMGENELLNEIQDLLKKFPEIQSFRSHTNYLEVTPKGVAKEKAIEKLVAYWNISPAEIMVFGDNFNDAQMIKFAGFGVAMGNAPNEIKALANHVTADNDSDGIYLALQKLELI